MLFSGSSFGTKIKTHKNVNLCTMAIEVRGIRVTKLKTTKIKFRGPFEEVTKIVSPENYRLYGIYHGANISTSDICTECRYGLQVRSHTIYT